MTSIMCETLSASSIRGLPRSPSAMMATPAKIEKTTICRISPSASDLKIEVGTTWSMKFSMLKAAVDRLAVLPPSSGITMPRPGCRMFTMKRPRSRETIDAQTNHPIVLAPTRPTVAASPIWPMPTTSVESTSGPMIILINFRKIALTNDMYLAISTAVALSGKE